MGLFDSLMGQNKQVQTPAPNQQTQQPNPNAAPNPNTQMVGSRQDTNNQNGNANGTVPGQQGNQQQADPTQNQQESPFSKFEKMWENDTTKGNTQQPDPFNVDPAKIHEAAKQTDFRKLVKPEQLAAMAQGGEQGVAASLDVINSMMQNLYAQSALASTRISKASYQQARKDIEGALPSQLRKHLASDNLRSNNQLLSNPAIKPMADALTNQLSVKFPNATANELQGMVTDFLGEMGKHFGPKKQEDTDSSSKKNETDWSTFLNN